MANWRTAFKSEFLASWDIDTSIILTLERVEVKEVQLQKKEKKVVAYFEEKKFSNGEPIKPMILNATNCKMLNTFFGTKETDNWKGAKLTIGVKENKGHIGESKGLSIVFVSQKEVKKKPEFDESRFESAYKAGASIEKIREVYSLSSLNEDLYKKYVNEKNSNPNG